MPYQFFRFDFIAGVFISVPGVCPRSWKRRRSSDEPKLSPPEGSVNVLLAGAGLMIVSLEVPLERVL